MSHNELVIILRSLSARLKQFQEAVEETESKPVRSRSRIRETVSVSPQANTV